MIHLFPLQDCLGKPVQPEVHEKQAEGRDHGDESKILGGEEPSQDDGGERLNGESQALGKHRDAGASDGEAAEPVAVRGGVEGSIRVEWLHPFSRCEGFGTMVTASRKAIPTGCVPLNAASVIL